jgi:hypothetical protein
MRVSTLPANNRSDANMDTDFNKKTIFAVLALAAVLAAMVFFAVMPILSEIGKAGVSVREQRGKIAGYDKRIAVAREFASFTKDEKNNLDNINGVFVDAQSPSDFINFINFLENTARNTLVNIDFSSSVPSTGTDSDSSSVGVEADISGNMGNILRFLKNIETSHYLVEVQGINIQISDAGGKVLAQVNGTSTESQAGSAVTEENRPARAHILLKAYAK